MDQKELREHLWPILYPEADEDFVHTLPHKRLATAHSLDCSYWSPREFSSSSIWNRVIRDEADPLHDSIQSLTVPGSLSLAAIRLFGESLIAYADQNDEAVRDGWNVFRFYPSVLLTFWSAFEAFVRLQSEFLLAMSSSLPSLVRQALAEVEEYLDDRGRMKTRSRRRSVLDRYALLLQYGYSHDVDRGAAYWQGGGAGRRGPRRTCALSRTWSAVAHLPESVESPRSNSSPMGRPVRRGWPDDFLGAIRLRRNARGAASVSTGLRRTTVTQGLVTGWLGVDSRPARWIGRRQISACRDL
jgi:hypothetical protein